ncbi:HAMP domain-containing sensor histidine kinase [Pseudonocardia sp. CA-107938]|uniref:HAMP domain-containing sensor histidine kinase n=1 Tax=Pseudonocardia sp. CA-107938 TaxID=3240021 RepID=UPI003D8F4EB5
MTLRARFAAACVAVAGVAIAAALVLSYAAFRSVLTVDTEQSFRALVDAVADRARHAELGTAAFDAPPDHAGAEFRVMTSRLVITQVLGPGGTIAVRDAGRPLLPVDPADVAVAAASVPGDQAEHVLDADGESYRVVAVALGGGRGAVQIAHRTTEAVRLLGHLAELMLGVGVVLFGLAALAGWRVADRVTRRLHRLTVTAERVAASGRLDTPVPPAGRDEVGRLGAAITTMLDELARARADQRRLIEDAGHELRTPLTSMRTNVTVLRRFAELTPDAQAALLDDLDNETRELTLLVDELVGISSERHTTEPVRRVPLAELAEAVAARARTRTGRTITVDAEPVVVEGRPGALDRALTNLVDNAAKFDDDGSPIEIVVSSGRIVVLDRGPGVADEDRDRIFDRFYRADDARSRPGSGLGLAIVRTVAAAHGGTVFVESRAGGGAAIGFTLSPDSHPGRAPVSPRRPTLGS